MLTERLGIRVIAEGAETAAQLKALKALGCREFQGYYFSRPLTPEKMTEMLRSIHVEAERLGK
jgi:EAL domain-containing protein (putative c-di-GMP-specific phosphodiesterase class I)